MHVGRKPAVNLGWERLSLLILLKIDAKDSMWFLGDCLNGLKRGIIDFFGMNDPVEL